MKHSGVFFSLFDNLESVFVGGAVVAWLVGCAFAGIFENLWESGRNGVDRRIILSD